MHAEPDGLVHPRARRARGEHDDGRERHCEHAWRANDVHDLGAAQHRDVPVHQHDVGIDSSDDGEPIGGLEYRLCTDVHQHHACQFARIRILVDDQKTDALD
jgi:hypothetical protein